MINSYIVKRTDRTSDGLDRYRVVRAHSVQEAVYQAAPACSAEPWEPATRPAHRLRWQAGHAEVLLATQPEAYPEIVSLGDEQTSEGCVYRTVPSVQVRELAERIFVQMVPQAWRTVEQADLPPESAGRLAAGCASSAFALAEAFVAEAAKRGIR